MVALPASGGRRQSNTTPAQKAEQCIRAAIRKEDLAIKYIEQGAGRVSDRTVVTKVMDPALKDIECAISATPEFPDAREDLLSARLIDRHARTLLLNHEVEGGRVRSAVLVLEKATPLKERALTTIEKATAPP